MSRADDVRRWALWLEGQEYEWGEESWYIAATPDPYDTDCSGLIYGVYRKCDIPWSTGGIWSRQTAAGYQSRSVAVRPPYRVGDVVCFGTPAYHIALYVGRSETVEARGERWGVVRYRLDDPIDGVFRRGGKVRRFPWVDLGELTEEDMDVLERTTLFQNRVSAVAGSYAFEILEAQILGDKAQAERLKQERSVAVERERVRLGLTLREALDAVSGGGGVVT